MSARRKQKLKIGILLLLALVLFRGPIYRFCINYEAIGTRSVSPISDEELLQDLSIYTPPKELDPMEMLEISRRLTDNRLSFTSNRIGNDAQTAYREGKANCIGYVALFSAIMEMLVQQHRLQDQVSITHQIGKLKFFGADIHAIFGDRPFFRDHDFLTIEDKTSGKRFHIDPTVSDYLGIRFVKSK